MPVTKTVHPRSRAAWRSWLARNHATSTGVWLVSFKKSTGKQRLSYEDSVEESLCFGWIDSLAKPFDGERSMQLFTPRKPKGNWSATNKRRVAALIAAGLMTERGMAAIEVAKRNGAWTAGDDAENLIVPADLRRALAAAKASRNFGAFSPSSRRAILFWIGSAKRSETRAKRIAETARLAAKNRRAFFDKE
ncbi:MAG TPA: YdeI/OmpD-associated family protein [Actinomycetota bacterium]